MLFKITNGGVSIGAKVVLEEVNFEIKEREKIALVGRNGSGKTTLLKVITGELELTEGIGEEKLNLTSSGAPVIGYLKQNAFSDENATMYDEILKAYESVIKLEKTVDRLALELENDHSEQVVAAFSKACEQFEFEGGYYYKKEYESALKKFGFTESDKSKKISEFSGGQRTRIALVRLILSKPDILLLDEPTNHLDIDAVEWLQDYLKAYKKSLVLVSHDRMFLDRIVNTVYEIEYGALTRYSGNYTAFAARKRENYQKQLKDHEAQVKEIDRLRRIADRFRYKPTKASMALSKLKQIERMQIIDAPDKYDMRTFHADFKPAEDSVDRVLSVKKLVIGYEKPFAEISTEVKRGEKIGIIGANGIGKSTFLKTLVGKTRALGGSFIYGVRVSIGYFDQQMALISSEKSVFEDFCDEFPTLNANEVRSSLAAFDFCGEDVFKAVSVLSGGEKVRLALCKILKRRPNLLILDEPTNHMDIVGKETLENMLCAYTGTLLIVSHDRYLINKVADKLIIFEKGGVRYFDGSYEAYEEYKRNLPEIQEDGKEKKEEKPKNTRFNPLKEETKRRARLSKLNGLIEETESRLSILSGELADESVYSDYVRCAEIQKEIDEQNAILEGYMLEFFELSEES